MEPEVKWSYNTDYLVGEGGKSGLTLLKGKGEILPRKVQMGE